MWNGPVCNPPPCLVHQPPPCRESSPPGCLCLPVWMNVSSLTPWLSDSHTVRFSVSSACFLFLNCCCPSFACTRRHSVSTYTSILARKKNPRLDFYSPLLTVSLPPDSPLLSLHTASKMLFLKCKANPHHVPGENFPKALPCLNGCL